MQSRRTLSPEHSKHDRVLVARYAAGDAYPTEIGDAQRLVDGCDECAALAADIKLISFRTSELPAARRTQDFRISAEQADKLRGSWFDRLMRGFSAPGWAVARPLAGAALAIGLALVVIGALPVGNLASTHVSDANPTFPNQVAGAATSLPVSNPLAPAPTQPPAEDSKGGVESAQGPLATQAPEFGGGAPASMPGTSTNAEPSMPRDMSATPGSPATVTQGSAPPPPDANQSINPVESPKAVAPTATANEAYLVPTAAPTQPPAAPVAGQGSVPPASSTSVDHSAFVIGGLIVAFFALIMLGLITVARRRYSDPLVR